MGEILTIEQAAEMLHLNPQVVRQYLREGKLPGAKIGRHWRIAEDELTAFVRSGRRQSTTMLSGWNERAKQWQSLSPDEKQRRVDQALGKYASVPFSSEDLMREKQEELDREELRLSGRQPS